MTIELWKTKIAARKVELSIIIILFILAAVAVTIFTYYDFQYSVERSKVTNEMLNQQRIILDRIEQTQQEGDIRTERIDTLTQYISEILAEQRFKDKQLHDIQLRIETDIQTLANQATRLKSLE